MITAEQVKDAVRDAGIIEIPHHDCGGCGVWVRYIVQDGYLFFDARCDCSQLSYPEPRDWQDAANWINMQSSSENRIELMRRFGIQTAA